MVLCVLRVLCRGIRQVSNAKADWVKGFNHCGCPRYSTCPAGMKVTICGAAGCTGQPLALLLKQCPLLDEVALYDQCATCGFGMELSHVDTKCKVSSYSGRHMLCDALTDAKIVVIMVRNQCDSFETNAPAVSDIAIQICNACPTTFTIVATEPVESMVPIVAEIQRLRSCYDPRKLLGCVELNCVRANTVMADFLRVPPETVRVPVIGGATPQTMVPILSSAVHPCMLTEEQVECLTSCIMGGGDAVCAAKACCKETACLAGAYAIARTTINVARGLQGQGGVVQCAYVDSLNTCAPCCQFFASQVLLAASGVTKNFGVPELSKFEHCLLLNCLPYVRNEIARAVWLAYSLCNSCCTPGCCVHPCTCYQPPYMPCVPPVNWTCDCPDACRDDYLASICRKMTCTDGSYDLCWRPRPRDYDQARALSFKHLAPLKSCPCNTCNIPRSVRYVQDYLERHRDPCCGRNV
ncbi:malate dehydrogenase, mitochondrial-like [Cydia strobilella]|uniref:malate dehydrogenase, mitochondrial-like n=1 Tax=Cydia strobilella TaxID=1100964 RepID=UPI0030056002